MTTDQASPAAQYLLMAFPEMLPETAEDLIRQADRAHAGDSAPGLAEFTARKVHADDDSPWRIVRRDDGTYSLSGAGGRAVRYMTVADIAALFGVSVNTVANWRARRYPDGDSPERVKDAAPFPQPDVIGGMTGTGIALWHPDREAEIRAWHASRPGQGAGGGRPRKNPA